MSMQWNIEPIRKAELHYPYAIYMDEDGEGPVPVRLTFPQEGDGVPEGIALYDPEIHSHKQWLCPCGNCGAKLFLVEKENEEGATLFWRSRNNSDHDDKCRFRNNDYNVEKGFLVRASMKAFANPHSAETMMNSLAEKYSPHNEHHPSFANAYQHLRHMERFRMATPQELVELYIKAGVERAAKSIFAIDGQYIPEEKFLIRRPLPKEENRYKDLHDRLHERARQNHIPCVMQFHIPHDREPDNGKGPVGSKSVFLYRELGDTGHGRPHFGMPRACPAKNSGINIQEIFSKAGDYLVAGYVSEQNPIVREGAVIHTMDIEIYSPKQIVQVDITAIAPPIYCEPEIAPRFSF